MQNLIIIIGMDGIVVIVGSKLEQLQITHLIEVHRYISLARRHLWGVTGIGTKIDVKCYSLPMYIAELINIIDYKSMRQSPISEYQCGQK